MIVRIVAALRGVADLFAPADVRLHRLRSLREHITTGRGAVEWLREQGKDAR